ncbi:substrate-binding domain-containing protein [Streptodolium elevatio]|uniref:Substrate-binding domain-containing protein n=1 Tax=Streptodolium elevatio TaxID=3157996 RepID=A0ABV3DS07_9ACTN
MRLARERHEFILRELQLKGSVRVADLVTALDSSEATLRRDIRELADAGLLTRVHGGAVAAPAEPPGTAAPIPVGIVVPSTTFYYPGVIRGAEKAATAHGVRLVLGVSHYRPDEERERVAQLLALGVRGLLLAAAQGSSAAAELGAWLDTLNVPVVLMERTVGYAHTTRDVDYVRTDHAQGTLLALRHFAALGHRKVALALDPATPTEFWLRRGYAEAVEQLGLDADAPDVPVPDGAKDPDGLRSALERLLRECRETGATAAFVHSDNQATRLVEAAIAEGLRVPEDLAVIAYDDEIAALGPVPLTAVSPPKYDVGEQAVRAMARRLAPHPGTAVTPHNLTLLPRLTIRESCGKRLIG